VAHVWTHACRYLNRTQLGYTVKNKSPLALLTACSYYSMRNMRVEMRLREGRRRRRWPQKRRKTKLTQAPRFTFHAVTIDGGKTLDAILPMHVKVMAVLVLCIPCFKTHTHLFANNSLTYQHLWHATLFYSGGSGTHSNNVSVVNMLCIVPFARARARVCVCACEHMFFAYAVVFVGKLICAYVSFAYAKNCSSLTDNHSTLVLETVGNCKRYVQ
jgi:hypothetical protein